MRLLILLITISLSFTSCNSQSDNKTKSVDENNVDLFHQFSDNLVHEKDSKSPYTGKLESTSKSDKVIINFKNGEKDGSFLRFNNNGDTLEYREYDEGNELFTIQYKYKNGQLNERNRSGKVKGDQKDIEIFNTAFELITDKKFDKLDDYLNPLWSSYGSTFTICEQLFGELKEFRVKKITKEYVEHQNSEHLKAKIDLTFRDTTFEVAFLIVEYTDNLKGQGFSFPSFDYDLKPDDVITEIIKDVNDKNIDEIINVTQFTEQHRQALKNDFDQIEQIDESVEFINCSFGLFPKTQLTKNYLINVGDENQILALTYIFDTNGDVEFTAFKFLPYRKPYMVLHNIL
tara:strand:+ start:15 stop:1049 length:1035 start_codon:yes stop_codon:yes gene_type:complete